jgi:transposase
MIRVAELTADEKWALSQHIKHSQIILVREKSQAVMLAASGVKASIIAPAVNKAERTVSGWLKAWNEIGIASIFSGHEHNQNASKLTFAQKEELRTALSVSPKEYGIPREFWDVPTLKKYLFAEFGVRYDAAQTYHYYLRFAGLSFKYPDKFDLKRDEEQVKLRVQAIATEIKQLRASDYQIFCVDEVRMQQEAEIRRAWLKKNERTTVKVNRQKESQDYLGLLSQDNFRCFLYKLDWINSKNVIRALKKFLESPEITYTNKRIAIIWDNASWHRSKELKEELKRGGLLERVHLIPMPPYAPNENPIEHVWNSAKKHSANIQHDSFKETKTRFENFVRNKTFKYSFRGINEQHF